MYLGRVNEDGSVEEQIPLAQGATVRKVVDLLVVRNSTSPEHAVKVTIAHQRKGRRENWDPTNPIQLNTLRAGEGVRLSLSSADTHALFEELGRAYEMARSGQVRPGEYDLVIGRAEEMVRTDAGRAAVIRELLAQNQSEEIWSALVDRDPDLATRLAYAQMHSEREAGLREFEEALERDNNEPYWQDFFMRNQWIFGYGLRYQFLNIVSGQPHYGGQSVSGTGDQRGDFLLHSQAETKYTALLEIKRPSTTIIRDDLYRNGANKLHPELMWAASQLQINCETWSSEGSRTERSIDELESSGIMTYCPRGILVIGHTNQLNDRNKRYTFEAYRKNLNNPEIVTFDELFERARFIVELRQ